MSVKLSDFPVLEAALNDVDGLMALLAGIIAAQQHPEAICITLSPEQRTWVDAVACEFSTQLLAPFEVDRAAASVPMDVIPRAD